MATQNKIKYEIEVAGEWYRCKKAAEQFNPRSGESNGWLHYELSDGTNGLARPGKWRKVTPGEPRGA